MHQVILIDDDDKLGPILTDYCAQYGLEVTAITRPSAGLAALEKGSYDAAILDVMLPEMDGFTLCRRIREQSEIPIIMLTARGEVTDRVVGLELGADDYLPKPFDPRELVARLHRIIQRKAPAPTPDPIMQWGELRIDPNARAVSVAGRVIDLTTMEYQLLLLLTENPGKDFSRDDILQQLKGTENELFSRSVDILISRLRSKLKPLTPIKTVYGSGYAFVTPSH